jgi:16S rRNA (uracil1498-N3)-methyltransferase
LRRRFFVERFDGCSAVLRGETAHHLGRVLRAEPGQLYELSDGNAVWLARTDRVGRGAIEFALVEPLPVRPPRLRVALLLAIVKFDRFEWSLEKATELGADEIVPLAAARSEKALIAAAGKRAVRWEKILLQSAQQARRLRPPTLLPSARPAAAFRDLWAASPGLETPPAGHPVLKILLSERPDAAPLRGILEGRDATSAALAIGPEGGWSDHEFAAAGDAGFAEASLGANILRTETGVVAALAVINYALGD